MATKLLTADNKPAATFDSGDRAILMPQLGTFVFALGESRGLIRGR